jgi:ketosteroid isomerase-like protein
MIRSTTLALPFLLASLAACTSSPSGELTDADRAAIRAVDAAWVELAASGKFSALVERCYTADAVLLPPNEPAAKGRTGIEAAMRAWPRMSQLTIESSEMVGSGDMAYTCGAYTATVHLPGEPTAPDKGKYVAIWRKDADGAWRMSRDCFNSDLPLAKNGS